MKSILKNFLLVGFICITSLLFYGCGAEDDLVIARVNGDKIYAQELNDIFNRSRKSFTSFDDEFKSRRDIVDSLVIQQLLIQEAYRKNIDDVEEVSRIVLAQSDRFLLDVLFQTQILDKIIVNENDIKDFYNMLEYKVHAFHILVTEQDTAVMILDSLKNGGNFENLAVQYSIDPQAKTTRGDLGFFIWGQMDPKFQEQVFKLEPGQISEPFETRYGWHIAKMVEKSPNELRGSFGQMSEQIERSLENMQRGEFLSNYRDQLMGKFPIRIDTITCEYLANKKASLYPPSILESLPNNDFDLEQLDRHERELIFASWDGGQVTLGQYLGQIRRLNPNQKPNLDDYDALAKFVFQLKFQEILLVEARRIGMENSDGYKEKIKKFRELTMADIMENDSIPIPEPPNDGEIRQYFEDNQGEFLIPPKVHIYEILFNDNATAETYANKIGSLERFKSLATQFTERSAKRVDGGDMGWIDNRSYPKYFQAAQESEIGDVVGPIQTGQKYALIYIADKKEEEIKDFLMVKQQIKDELESQMKSSAFDNWIEEHKSEASIKIYENNIRASINREKYADADSTSS